MRGKRLDIQGMRALAVVLVVAFHLWPKHLPGGYVGVDVFFVISGFLITSHLLGEVHRTGTVSLPRFWARRVRRLLPASFTVLGFSLVAAFVFLPKSLLQQTLFEIGASALYVQNWVLAGNSVDYLAAENRPTLAQHFWSLSVEEQFYIAWPIIIVGAVAVASKIRRSDRLNRRAIAIALGAVFIGSLAYSIFETARSQPSAYFITPTRAWEFAAGGLLAFAPAWGSSVQPSRRDSILRLAAGWGGLALIVGSAVQFDARTQFPGYVALVPVLGAVLLIHAGQRELRWTPGHLSRFRPVQFLGDTSYAIYLWHWPLIILYPYILSRDLSFIGKVFILIASVLLAAATKYFVEDRVRDRAVRLRKPVWSFAFMAAGMLALLLVVGVATTQITLSDQARATELEAANECLGAKALTSGNDCRQPFAITGTVDPGFAANDLYWGDGSVQAGGTCKPALGDIIAACEFGELDSPTMTIALIGNSHGEHMVEPMAIASASSEWRLIPHVRARCSGFESREQIRQKVAADPSVADDQAECYEWGQAVVDSITERSDIDVVLVTASGVTSTSEAITQVERIVKSGKQVVLLGDSPAVPNEMTAPECVEKGGDTYDPCSWVQIDSNADLLATAAALGVPSIDISPNFCSEGRCHAVIGGLITYFDNHHMTLSYSRTLAPFLEKQVATAVVEGTERE